jgi:TPR repeat protein
MIARYDIQTLEKIEDGKLFKSIDYYTMQLIRGSKKICMKCCSEKVFNRYGDIVHCATCSPDVDGPTTISVGGDFYNNMKTDLTSFDTYKGSLADLRWTDVVRYASSHGFLGDKKAQYDNILTVEDIGQLAKLYEVGDGIATARLAECYACGIGVEKNAMMAYKLFFIAETRGETYSAFIRAIYLRFRYKYQYAFMVLGQAADKGNPVAMYHFAEDIYSRKKPNYQTISYGWWKKSADMGFLPSMLRCGEYAPSTEEKEHYYNLAKNKGSSEARKALFDLYLRRARDPKDELGMDFLLSNYFYEYVERFEQDTTKEAKFVFQHPDCLMGIYENWILKNASPIMKAFLEERKETFEFSSLNEQECVFEWLKKDLGKNRVVFEKGRLTINLNYNEEIDDEDCEIDYSQLTFTQRLERAKSGDSWAQLLVGDAYQYGEGVGKNDSLAIRWYITSLTNGEDMAYDELANIYRIRRDNAIKTSDRSRFSDCANACIYHGAKAGCGSSCFFLGVFFDRISRNESDICTKLALVYYLRSAIQYIYGAINNIGTFFKNRVAVDLRDYSIAASCFKIAAEAGDEYGMFNLGECYEYGNGVPRDYSLAGKWYLKAQGKGHKAAGDRYDKLYRENKLNHKTIEKAVASDVEKGDVNTFFERVMEHLDNKYYEDAATNIRHIEETILSYFVQVYIPECIFDNKGVQRKKLEQVQAIPQHYIEILYNIGKVGNSGAHANGAQKGSVTEQDIKRMIPPLKDLISFYEEY